VARLHERLWRTDPMGVMNRVNTVERARRLWRFWHRDRSRWVVLNGKGKVCFGPDARRAAFEHARRSYDAEAARGMLPKPYRIQEVFG
jgi:hypothetical protein